ncbi:WbqC family protein [Nitrincola sp. MINF-07-Sa-05]|uniref:WbqC family protein n=1 Tax=Nitrincola salilacus TaxID=3400273 RepID=UPI0039185BC9
MTCVVISQPMYFPWPGILEQYRLCDTFIYYDDVQFSRGFFNRVQIKTAGGRRWLTVPLLDWHRGQLIQEVYIDNSQDWKRKQRDQLRQAYAGAPFKADMLDLVDAVFSRNYHTIGELAQESTEALVRYFPPISKDTFMLRSSELSVTGASTERLINLCRSLGANQYLTGHGARNYLEHERFEQQGINVSYIDYGVDEYTQLHGPFTPYVSSLDLIANCGQAGIEQINGNLQPWRNFIKQADQSQVNHEE